jgi:DNA-binding transcriptional ArsR family regulator
MSLDALKWAWEQDCPNPTAKLVLMALADHANSDGECWPSMKRVAELTGVSTRQVSNHIVALEQLGYVTKGDRRRWQGQLRGWDYRVNLRKPATSGSVLPVTSGNTASSPAEAGFRSEPLENRKEEPLAAAPRETAAKKDELFEAVAEACGIDWNNLTPSGRGPLNRAVKELKGIGVTADQVGGRAAAYRRTYPEAPLTPTALSKHWAALTPAQDRRRNVRPACEYCDQPLDDHDQQVCETFGRFT